MDWRNTRVFGLVNISRDFANAFFVPPPFGSEGAGVVAFGESEGEPMVALDVVAHEFGHGVVYHSVSNRTGSDIFDNFSIASRLGPASFVDREGATHSCPTTRFETLDGDFEVVTAPAVCVGGRFPAGLLARRCHPRGLPRHRGGSDGVPPPRQRRHGERLPAGQRGGGRRDHPLAPRSEGLVGVLGPRLLGQHSPSLPASRSIPAMAAGGPLASGLVGRAALSCLKGPAPPRFRPHSSRSCVDRPPQRRRGRGGRRDGRGRSQGWTGGWAQRGT